MKLDLPMDLWYSNFRRPEMMYPFMTLEDGTGIAHSEIIQKDGKDAVKVCFEQPIEGGFNSAECWLPDYSWSMNCGFTAERLSWLQEYLQSIAHVIYKLARSGGFDNASSF